MNRAQSIVRQSCIFLCCLSANVSMANDGEIDQSLERRFVACPIYRDTDSGPKSGCWLTNIRETGEQFDVSKSLTKPISDRTILVEGRVSNEAVDACGAPVLYPVRVSVLDERCSTHIISAEGFKGRAFRPLGEVMRPLSVPRELPKPPFKKLKFTILFNYGTDFLNYQYSEVILEKISLLVRASNAVRVEITGSADVVGEIVSGYELKESPSLAQQRAAAVALALTRLGIDTSIIQQFANLNPEPASHYANGLSIETLRRVDIQITLL